MLAAITTLGDGLETGSNGTGQGPLGRPLRLGFVANTRLGHRHGSYYYQTGEWRYVRRLAPLFSAVDICASVLELDDVNALEQARYVYDLHVPNATIHDLGHETPGEGVLSWVRRQMRARAHIASLSRYWHMGFLMTPGWPSLLAWLAQRHDRWPYAVSVRADWAAVIRYRAGRPAWARWVLLPYALLARRIEESIVRKATLRMAAGPELAARCPDLAPSLLATAEFELPLGEFRRREDTCSTPRPRLLFVGRLSRTKAVDVAIRAVSRLISSGLDVEFHIAGDGPERAALVALASSLGLDGRVIFHGYLPGARAVLELCRDCDVFVLSSLSEGFPRVLYEAMSQSLPVIATRVGGIPGVLRDGETALLVPPAQVDAMAAALRRVLTDAPLRQRLIGRGYDMAYRFAATDPLEKTYEAFAAQVRRLQAYPLHPAGDGAGSPPSR